MVGPRFACPNLPQIEKLIGPGGVACNAITDLVVMLRFEFEKLGVFVPR
jgi:hypothetical protein